MFTAHVKRTNCWTEGFNFVSDPDLLPEPEEETDEEEDDEEEDDEDEGETDKDEHEGVDEKEEEL